MPERRPCSTVPAIRSIQAVIRGRRGEPRLTASKLSTNIDSRNAGSSAKSSPSRSNGVSARFSPVTAASAGGSSRCSYSVRSRVSSSASLLP
jgi:hypothetical protein